MAHRIQRRSVRGGGHVPHRGPGALLGSALVALLLALAIGSPAGAQAPAAIRDDLLESGLPDAPSWWAEPGRAGFVPDLAAGVAYPWALAGHVRGGWAIDEPDLAPEGPFPGLAMVETPLAWADSLAINAGGQGAWSGFDGALARARLLRRLPPPATRGRARALGDLALSSGSSAYDGNALSVTRGDSSGWARAGASSWTRGGLGALAPAGRHHWDLEGAWTRGRQRLDAGIAQAGSAAALVSGEEQAASGAGGRVRYGLALDRMTLGLELGRGYDHHESYGGSLLYSRRDAHERRAAFEVGGRSGDWGARLDVRDAWVTRVTDLLGETPWTSTSAWLAARVARRRGPARIEASLGAGRHGGVDRTELAPSLVFGFREKAVDARAYLERVLAPVWSDLAPGEAPFLQSTWVGGFDLSARSIAGSGAGLGWRMGRTRDRAMVGRYPFEELWLRSGYAADPSPYDFGLATAAGDLRWSAWRMHGEAFSLFRDTDSPQALVDPRRGGRASVETGFRAFQGDLGVRLRGEVEVMGGRQSPTTFGWISGDASFGVTAAMTLSDVMVTMRMRNLEDKRRPLPWTDPLTGEDALSEGMEFRLGITWRLYN